MKEEKEIVKPKRKYTRKKKEDTKPTEIDYVRYVGNNSLTFLNKFKALKDNRLSFNLGAALFGLPYLVYRKLYLTASLYILLSMILPSHIVSYLLLAILLGVGTDYVYLKKADYFIEKIKSDKDTDKEIKDELIRQSGGVDSLSAALIVIIGVFLTTLLFTIVGIMLPISLF